MEFRNANITQQGIMYGKWSCKKDTWVIHYGNVYCYLLIGEDCALLFDTAYGAGDLRAFVEGITQKPLLVVNSHGHYDHTGGNAWWPEVYAGPGAEKICKIAFSLEMQLAHDAKPFPDYVVHTVRDGDMFALGGRKVEVIQIPAHHESSIALLDHGSRSLLTGDEMEAGQVLLFVRGDAMHTPDIALAHLANMKKLKSRTAEFDHIFPAHNGTPLTTNYIDDFIGLSQSILDGTQQVQPDLAGFGFPPSVDGSPFADFGAMLRAQFGGASFIYRK